MVLKDLDYLDLEELNELYARIEEDRGKCASPSKVRFLPGRSTTFDEG